ncbi:MAG: tail fiber domain-containing protein [Bacteroidetes bacterium]|nr:tail fiber domain-containing protein [Bacteroidota bacterium]
MQKQLFTTLACALISVFARNVTEGQNVAITDVPAYTAHPSAMLDVKATDKGMLVPRMSTAQRTLISNPAGSLLVYDTDEESFFYYTGAAWTNLSAGNPDSLWNQNQDKVFLYDTTLYLKIGSTTFPGKMTVHADSLVTGDKPIFGVVNASGDTVFAVYSQGVRINVADSSSGAKAGPHKAGFAVGGFSLSKGLTSEYLRVTPDSVRIYIKDTNAVKSPGNKGGFAVGGFSLSKGITGNNFWYVSTDSTRGYTMDTAGGFGVENLEGSDQGKFLYLRPSNYFIGHFCGIDNTSGLHNCFFGFASGRKNTTGSYNVFLGKNSGYSNLSASNNVFAGYYSGVYNFTGENNVCLGYNAGYYVHGDDNTIVGPQAGKGYYSSDTVFSGNCIMGQTCATLITGSNNCCFGEESAYYLHGDENIVIGWRTGKSLSTNLYNKNTFLGTYAGYELQWGDYNAFLGRLSGYNSEKGRYNTYCGLYAGRPDTAGRGNVYFGNFSGYNRVGGHNNIGIGPYCGYAPSSASYCNNVFLGYYAGRYEADSNRLYIENADKYAEYTMLYGEFDNEVLRTYSDVGIGMYPAANRLEVNGDASKTTAGDWLANSDKRIKTDIREIENATDLLLKLHPVTFRYTEDWLKTHPEIEDKVYYNYIAQEFRDVFPEAVKGSGQYSAGEKDELLQIDTYPAQVVCLRAIQEAIQTEETQNRRIESISAKAGRIDRLVSETEEIQDEIERITATLKTETTVCK